MIYLLYDYDDHGPQSIAATHDRKAIQSLFDRYIAEYPDLDGIKDRMADGLNELLAKPDEEILGSHQLTWGWGGLTLHVVAPDVWQSPDQ